MVVAKMEVDSWVSVQARREQFEQLYEDSPLVSPQKTPSFQPTPRPRTLSIPNKNSQNCDELRGYQGKNSQSFYHEFNCKDSKLSPNKGPQCTGPDVVNSGQLPKNNILVKKHVNSPSQRKEESSHNIVPPKSSPTKVIPVFRTTSVAADRTNVAVEKTVTPADASPGKRGRFFSHIRSRSHGNFIVKRDPSEERVSSAGQKNGVAPQKENKFHKDWMTPKRKQRSTDDLLSPKDSTNSSSFEGKQRLVSNVVKNMKNKETPTVLRKLSFSSKNEKDFKNMKEKSVTPNKSNKQSALLTSLSGKAGIAHLSKRQRSNSKDSGISVNHKPALEEKPTGLTSHSSGKAKVPELIARAVAEVASKRYAAQTRDIATPYSSDERLSDPPERPPRRRTPCPGQPPRRKGKAPSPPSQSSPSETEHTNSHSDTPIKMSPPEESSKTMWHRFRDSSSLDNLESPASIPPKHLVVRSCENLPDVVHTSSPKSSIFYTNLKSAGRPTNENRHDSDNDRDTSNKDSQGNMKHINANQETSQHNMDEGVTERTATEVEGLPGGPPPKKPPRTFAYDIYKNVSTPPPEAKTDDRGKKENTATKSAQPIYAVPVKKSNKMMIPKPPVRSKSDLSKENTKPSVAPKPPHVLAKAKRTSLVDPLSNLENEEEAATTSEFQRQAHVRYSLRRPEDPPQPPSSPGQDGEGNSRSDSKSKLSVSSLDNQHDMGYSTIHYNKENGTPTSERDINSTVSSTQGSAEHKSPRFPDTTSPSEYEHVTPKASSSVAASCHGGGGTSENEQPLSLTYCFANTPSPDVTYTHKQRSMSDETLYKGSKQGEPVYATPTFKMNNHNADKTSQELHYMCSILFTDEEEADAGRDRGEGRFRRNSVHGREKALSTEAEDGNKGRSSLISAWKREFRQSCRQVQSRIKKTVAR